MNKRRKRVKEEQKHFKPRFVRGKIPQPSRDAILTDWDLMTIAKNAPGTIDSPFVAGMNVTPMPTSTFSVASTLSQIYDVQASDLSQLGSREYTVILY